MVIPLGRGLRHDAYLHGQGLDREVTEHFLDLARRRLGWTSVRLLGNHPAQAA